MTTEHGHILHGQAPDPIVLSPQGEARWFTPQLVMLSAGIIDFGVMCLTAAAAAYIYPGYNAPQAWGAYYSMAGFGAAVLIGALVLARCYSFGSILSPFRRLGALIGAWVMTFAILLSAIFLAKFSDDVSRVWLVTWATSGLLIFLAWRFLYGAFIRQLNADSHFNKNAVLVGGGDNAGHVISVIQNSRESGISLLGIFDDRGTDRVAEEVKGLRKLGRIDDLVEFVRGFPVDTLIVTLPTTAETRLAQLVEKLWVLPVNIRLSAATQKLHYTQNSYTYIGNLPCLNLYDKPLGEWGPLLKNVMDKVIATLALIALSPVLILTAIAVRLDSKGPIFFKQSRYGFNNELIGVYKFRSMYVDRTDSHGVKSVSKGDPRVTRVGRFIRRTSIDELPQLFNVLKGELSLVGPRPHATQSRAGENLFEHVVHGYFARHRVKPGLTGWAQINGWRGETDTVEKLERRVECDLYYIENWSLSFDLYILARTPFALLNTQNAY